MEFGRTPALLLLVGVLWSQLQFGSEAAGTTVFTLRNNCTYTVWPATLSGNTAVAVGGGGFELSPGANVSFPAPAGWSGRLWARTDCAPSGTASLACATGDCGGAVSCSLGGYAGCVGDVNALCPAELQVAGKDQKDQQSSTATTTVACRSACEAFGTAEYCCTGAHGGPDSCGPTRYSRLFKAACPAAYSYAYDDPTSTFTCGTGAQYVITFCPAQQQQ
uniref:Thaumatin-like protein n=1 Tax=Oryza punctata TaxID=4537 RepID=A0A0E0KAY7_ORYPU